MYFSQKGRVHAGLDAPLLKRLDIEGAKFDAMLSKVMATRPRARETHEHAHTRRTSTRTRNARARARTQGGGLGGAGKR
eukprot:6175893-Pleurochrysis_carterae.AAC.1